MAAETERAAHVVVGASRPEDDYLARTRHLVELAIRRRWAEGLITRDPDGVFAAFLGSGEVEKLFAPPAPVEAGPRVVDFPYLCSSPLGRLAEHLGLSPTETDLLAVLLSCESDPTSARLITYLGGNQAQFTMTVDLLVDIVYRGRVARQSDAAAMVLRDVAPKRLLRRLRYLVVDGADTRVALAQGIRLHPRLVAWLLGDDGLDPELMAFVRLHPPEAPLGECAPDLLDPAVAALSAGGRLLLVEGAPQSGREMLLRFAAAEVGRPLLVTRGRGLTPDRLVAVFREASLRDAIVAIRDADEALAGEGMHRFRECLDVFPATISVLDVGQMAAPLMNLRPTTTALLQVPPVGERMRLWRDYLGDDRALAAEDFQELAALYNLGIQGIVSSSEAALEAARFAGEPLARRHVSAAVRSLFDVDLSTVATRVEVTQGWEDLVLPEDLAQSILSIIDRIRFRGQVLGKWGFARKLGKGLGLTVLFSGEPGTGKSMVAGLIAAELGLDLYVVDLSQISSKWIGETEKNLGRAFDAAEAGHVLLLFDEADSILGKRSSDIRSSNDRHANLETNFILARIEQFQGIAFFTTNLPSAIDPAIARRMSVHVNFPFPDGPSRADLWRRMIPTEAPVDPAINFAALGERYELSGGFIRNIVLRAAYLAVREDSPIATVHLEAAAEAEYRERGLLLVGGRLS